MHGQRLIVGFEGIDTISQAELLAGWQVQLPADELPPAGPGRVYVGDLVGCRVLTAGSDLELGVVAGWLETGGVPLLEVAGGKREILIPFAASICVDVDTASRRIRVTLPEGLEELNAKASP